MAGYKAAGLKTVFRQADADEFRLEAVDRQHRDSSVARSKLTARAREASDRSCIARYSC